MSDEAPCTIRIAAAPIEDGAGRLLLVRKAGTGWFMQAGGKIEDGESPVSALRRELSEEIGAGAGCRRRAAPRLLLRPAANEPGYTVEAEIFHVRTQHAPATRSEIEEAVWVDHITAMALPLAPLTRDHILPLSLAL